MYVRIGDNTLILVYKMIYGRLNIPPRYMYCNPCRHTDMLARTVGTSE